MKDLASIVLQLAATARWKFVPIISLEVSLTTSSVNFLHRGSRLDVTGKRIFLRESCGKVLGALAGRHDEAEAIFSREDPTRAMLS